MNWLTFLDLQGRVKTQDITLQLIGGLFMAQDKETCGIVGEGGGLSE